VYDIQVLHEFCVKFYCRKCLVMSIVSKLVKFEMTGAIAHSKTKLLVKGRCNILSKHWHAVLRNLISV